MDIATLVQAFNKMELSKQKEKLLVMLEQIKDSDPMFLELYNIINTRADLDINFLTGTYQDILELGKAVVEYNTEKQQTKLSALQEKLKTLYEREKQERIIELQEAENLIKNI